MAKQQQAPNRFTHEHTWYRNAGWKKLHKPRRDWIRSGKAVCGADLRNPGFAFDGGGPVPDKHHTELSSYPKRFGWVTACQHCAKGVMGGRA